MKKTFKKTMTLRNRFIVTSYISIAIPIILICIVCYLLFSNNSHKFAVQASTDVIQQKNGEIRTRMRGLEVTIRDIIYSRELQRLLGEEARSGSDPYLHRIAVNQTISQASNSLYMIDNIAVFSIEGELLGSMFEFDSSRMADEYSWYEEAAGSNGETVWLKDSVTLTSDNYGPHMAISAVKKIRSVHDSDMAKLGETMGYVYFTVNLDSMMNFSQSEYINEGRQVFVVAGDARIIGGTGRERLGDMFEPYQKLADSDNRYIKINGEDYLCTYAVTDPSMDWYTVCLTQRAVILQDARMAIVICVGMSVVLLIVFYGLSLRNADSLSRPIKHLEEEFEMVEQGDFAIEIKGQTGIKEVDNLFSRFHVMAYRLDRLIHEVYDGKIKEQKLIVEARQAQLQSLQMQINPHFLYNTLDSINWMALMEGNQDVSRMILALGHLFRSNMNTVGLYTVAREEIENVKLYMFLETVRFEGKLSYQTEMEPGVGDAVILKHILQPLVENSIKYGVESYHIKMHIFISLKRSGEDLEITVSDNGRGMKPERLKELQQMWKEIAQTEDTADGQSGGVGIRNIMRRLWLCYGEAADFQVSSSETEGTVMQMRFPFSVTDEII